MAEGERKRPSSGRTAEGEAEAILQVQTPWRKASGCRLTSDAVIKLKSLTPSPRRQQPEYKIIPSEIRVSRAATTAFKELVADNTKIVRRKK